ncbi:hypothetical protein NMG60_11029639 [Bertholletia excelsa]
MDNNNWRPAQGGGEPTVDTGDWKTQLQPESRQRIVNKIMETLKRHLPFSGQEGLQELKRIAVRFEEKIFTAATSQSDYLRKISLKMLTMETKSQNTMSNSLPSNSANNSRNPPDSASLDSTAQTGNVNSEDWQEEIYQKIKTMKEAYLPELNEMYQEIAGKLQQHDSLPQQPKNEQLEKLKISKAMLERIMAFLQVSKNSILPGFKDKLGSYEKQIINFHNSNRPRKPGASLQQGQQLPQSHLHPMRQPQQPQSQITSVQPHENQMNPQLQSMNLLGSGATMLQNNVAGPQHNSLSSLSGVPNASQDVINSIQPTSNMDSGQGNAQSALQQVAVGSLQQNPVSAPQQSISNMLQPQHLKQQEQQILQTQTQQLKQQQFQQRQMHQQFLHKQQLLQQHQQQLHQRAKQQQQQNAQLQAHQMPQLHQINDVNDLKMRQQMAVKSGGFPHHSVCQHAAYHGQQMKSGAQFPISAPQLLQTASPQCLRILLHKLTSKICLHLLQKLKHRCKQQVHLLLYHLLQLL